jgi:hypothetical protein
VTQLWTVVEVGPVLEVNQPATPADILADARTIEGAEEVSWCKQHRVSGSRRFDDMCVYVEMSQSDPLRPCRIESVLVVPIADTEGGER